MCQIHGALHLCSLRSWLNSKQRVTPLGIAILKVTQKILVRPHSPCLSGGGTTWSIFISRFLTWIRSRRRLARSVSIGSSSGTRLGRARTGCGRCGVSTVGNIHYIKHLIRQSDSVSVHKKYLKPATVTKPGTAPSQRVPTTQSTRGIPQRSVIRLFSQACNEKHQMRGYCLVTMEAKA